MSKPCILISPRAWARLMYFRQRAIEDGGNEVGGFGITPYDNHPLYVDNVELLGQDVTTGSVNHREDDIKDYVFGKIRDYDNQHKYMSFWWHFHTEFAASPSSIDEGQCREWKKDLNYFVMFILGKKGQVDDITCRLHIKTMVGWIEQHIPIRIAWEDYCTNIDPEDTFNKWDEEYDTLVRYRKWNNKVTVYENGNVTYKNWQPTPNYVPNQSLQRWGTSKGGPFLEDEEEAREQEEQAAKTAIGFQGTKKGKGKGKGKKNKTRRHQAEADFDDIDWENQGDGTELEGFEGLTDSEMEEIESFTDSEIEEMIKDHDWSKEELDDYGRPLSGNDDFNSTKTDPTTDPFHVSDQIPPGYHNKLSRNFVDGD